jgi:mitogen-activated protein kinase kinase kinase 7
MSNTTEQVVKKIRLKVECPLIDDNKLIFQDSDHFVQHGAYGKVCRAKMDGQEVAVKYFKSAEEKRGYKQELVFLKCLQKHDNIVHLFGTGLSKKSQEPYIVMEFAPYSLERVLHGIYPKYSYGADHVMHWSRQTAVGINYIHSKRILHRDIKSSNLLLFGNGSHLKLCDFGTCRNLETNLLYTASIGTVRYMAPEVIQGDTYTTMCDVFSFAITLWEMLARKVPSIELGENISSFAILYQMAQGKRPPLFVNVPQFINELLIR